MQRRWIFLVTVAFLLCGALASAELADLDSILEKAKIQKTDLGIMVLDNSDPVFSLNETRPFMPASLTKIITAGAALHLLGPQYQFKTQVATDGTVFGQTLHGSIYLKSSGDPSFNVSKLQLVVNLLANQKVKRIQGDIVIDDRRFDDCRASDWETIKGIVRSWRGDTSALFVNVDPPFDLPNFTTKLEDKQRTVVMDERQDLLVYQNMIQPDLWTGYSMISLFQKAGIAVDGSVQRGTAPPGVKILAEISSPLTKVISDMLKTSNNHTAEMLALNLAADQKRTPVAVKTGLDVIRQFLDVVGIPRSDYRLASAAGFSRRNFITPIRLCQVLQYLKARFNFYPAFLPLAGVDGTLRHRMRQTPAFGKILAKTGYLMKTATTGSVVGLAGFVPRSNGHTLTFAFIYNGHAQPSLVRKAFDTMCVELISDTRFETKLTTSDRVISYKK